jgi:hypothetical protein
MAARSDSTGSVESVITLSGRLLDLGIEDALVMDGFDDCAIGILERCGMKPIVIYDKEKIIDQLMVDEGYDHLGANDYYQYNQLGSWLSDKAPGFLIRLPGM